VLASHHTKDKGDLGVYEVMADLGRHDIYSCIPISEHLPFDIVAVSHDGELRRIQVKYRSLSKIGNIVIELSSNHSDRNGVHKKPVDLNSFDCYALYCPQTDKVYYVRNDEIAHPTRRCFTIRIEPPRNKQRQRINLASEYEGADRIFTIAPVA
jgi:hypothetical protein